ncbi:MAG: ANTAR domain-containing response regulator [Planctomycetia bacterium]
MAVTTHWDSNSGVLAAASASFPSRGSPQPSNGGGVVTMKRSLRIVVADDEVRMREYLQELLPRMGHTVVASAATGNELINVCRSHRPDLVLTDIKMPDLDGIDAAVAIYREQPVPIILISAHHDKPSLERASGVHVMAYLVKPIELADLEAAIMVATRRFEQFQSLQKEAADLRQALEDRKIIERAKGILMKRGSIDEEEAFRRLQKTARDRNQKLVQVAGMIVTTEEILRGDHP